jgi:2'-5' RNA ligase
MDSPTSETNESAQAAIEHVDELQDHWWWRPGWRAGRHFYACHITLRDQPGVQALVATYQAAIRGIEGLEPIPAEWLHLTMQGIGFVDEIDAQKLTRTVACVQRQINDVPAPTVSFHMPVVRPEAVYLPASPSEPLRALRAAAMGGIAEALRPERLHHAPEQARGYRPHVSIAYSNRRQPSRPIVEALSRVQPAPVTAVISEVSLLEFHRDRRMYEWVSAEPLTIGAEPLPGG